MQYTLIRSDFLELPDLFMLPPESKLILQQMVYLSQRTQIGMFHSHRDQIASKISLESKKIFDFIEKNPKLIYFDEDDHVFWVKKYYHYVSFGLEGDLLIERKKRNSRTGKKESVLVPNTNFRDSLNRYISCVKKAWKEPYLRYKINLKKEWVKENHDFLKDLNFKLKSFEKNNRDCDDLLMLLEDKVLLTDLSTGFINKLEP